MKKPSKNCPLKYGAEECPCFLIGISKCPEVEKE